MKLTLELGGARLELSTLGRQGRAIPEPPSPASGPTKRLPDFAQWTIGHPIPMTNVELGHIDAFYQVPIVNAAVRKIADDQASITRRVYVGTGPKRKEVLPTGKLPVQGGNLRDLLDYGNHLNTGRDVIAATVASIVVSGNGYQFVSREDGGMPYELTPFPGHLVRAVPGIDRTIERYDITRASTSALLQVAADRMIQFPSLTLRDEQKGSSWLEAASSLYQGQYYALLWLRDFYKKGGVLAGVYKTSEGVKTLVEDEAQEMIERLRRQSQNPDGTAKRWAPQIIQGLDFVKQGMTMSEMEIDAQLDAIDARIARCLGVPPTILGIHQGSRGLNAPATDNERSEYWLGTQASLANLIDERWNRFLTPFYGSDVYIESDLRSVPSVRAILISEAKGWGELTGEAILSVNEAREKIGEDSAGPEYDKPAVTASPIAAGVPEPGTKPGTAPPADTGNKADPNEPKPAKNSARLSESTPRDQLRAKRRASLDAYRARWEAFSLGRLKAQREHANALLAEAARKGTLSKNGSGPVRLALDPEELVPDADEADLKEAQKLVEQLIRERGAEALKELADQSGVALEVSIRMQSDRAAAFIRAQVDRAISIPDATTRRELRMRLAEAISEGASIADTTERLKLVLDASDALFDVREAQALTIARTETLSAFNFASMEAFRESEVVSESEWLTSHSGLGGRHSENPDGRYDDLDGQRRSLGEAFNVGGFSLLYPGDPDGPVGETANCVCTLIGKVDESLLRARVERDLVALWNAPAVPKPIADRIRPKVAR